MNPIIEAIALLTPYDVDKRKIRIGPNSDGGYVFLDDFSPSQTVISYGISTEYSFDAIMARNGHKVFMFDHTIEKIVATSENMKWFKEGLSGETNVHENVFSIEDHLLKYRIDGNDLILKMDVEGVEYEAIRSLNDSTLARFSQITMELHNLHSLGQDEFRSNFVHALTKLNRQFTLFHVHANNYDGPNGFMFIDGIPVTNLLEVSYVRSDKVVRGQSETLYPTIYDYPCVGHKDKLLWFFPFLPTSKRFEDFMACEERLSLITNVRNAGAEIAAIKNS